MFRWRSLTHTESCWPPCLSIHQVRTDAVADPSGIPGKVIIFLSYAHENAELCERLETHLSLLKQQELLQRGMTTEFRSVRRSKTSSLCS